MNNEDDKNPKPCIDMTFRPCDDILKMLVTKRCKEAMSLAKAKAEHQMDLETRAKKKVNVLKKVLPKDICDATVQFDKIYKANNSCIKSIKMPTLKSSIDIQIDFDDGKLVPYTYTINGQHYFSYKINQSLFLNSGLTEKQ